MATGQTDFSEYATGVFINEDLAINNSGGEWASFVASGHVTDGVVWSIVDSPTVIGGKYLQCVIDAAAGGGDRSINYLNVPFTIGDIDIVVKWRYRNITARQFVFFINIRVAESSGDDRSEFFIQHRPVNTAFSDQITFRRGRIVQPEITIHEDTTTFKTLPNTWYVSRFKRVGSDVKYNIWLATESEPASWGIEFSDPPYPGDGYFGVGAWEDDSDQQPDIDFFSWATAGDDAPLPPAAITITGDPVITYTCTLTGAADSLPDLTLPISSLQARIVSAADSYLQVVVPDLVTYIDDIAARPNGDIVVYRVKSDIVSGQAVEQIEILTVNLETVRTDEGPFSHAITLSGHKQETYTGPETIELGPASYKSDNGATTTYRCVPNANLKPGDTANINGESLVVSTINITVNANQETMEING